MKNLWDTFQSTIEKSDFIFALFFVGLLMYLCYWISAKLTRNKLPGAAIAITAGLVLASFGGKYGIADLPLFSGMKFLGGPMMRDFAIVATAMGASFLEIKRCGWLGVLSLFIGIFAAFLIGGMMGYALGYTDAKSFTTIGAGACTFIVGPITGAAIGAPSEVIAISIAIGVIKSVIVTLVTPLIAKRIGLDNPVSAMVFGGLLGTTSGVSAGLAATDPKLVPYGALTATFYTGLGCLLCPSLLYLLVNMVL